MPPPPPALEPFDRAARRRQRARATPGDHDFLRAAMAADLAARVADFGCPFAVVADLGGSGLRGTMLTVVVDAAAAAVHRSLDAPPPALPATPPLAPPAALPPAPKPAPPAGPPAAPAAGADTAAAAPVGHDDAAPNDAFAAQSVAPLAPSGVTAASGPAPVGVVADADRLPLADASVDLVVALGLHAVGDLPGALILARRALRPGGVFLAAFVGGATLTELRADLLAAESDLTGGAAARVLPMVDPDAAAGLLQRAGLADPVAEVDTLTVRYADLAALLADLRASGEGNILHGRVPLRRAVVADAARRFAARAVDGRVAVTVQVIYLTGRAPPARG